MTAIGGDGEKTRVAAQESLQPAGARNLSRNRVLFWLIVIIILVVIQTPIPKLVLQSALGAESGSEQAKRLKEATPGLVTSIIVLAFFDATRERSDKNALLAASNELRGLRNDITSGIAEMRAAATTDALSQTEPRQLLRNSLERMYGTARNLDDLLYAVAPDERGVCRDVSADYLLADIDGDPSRYRLTCSYRMTVTGMASYLCAFVANEKLGALLVAKYPQLVTVWTFSDVAALRTAVDRVIGDDNALQYAVASGDGSIAEFVSGPLRRVPADQYAAYSIEDSSAAGDPIELLHVAIPAGPNDDVRVITTVGGDVLRAVPACYFWADRPTFVRRLTFDWSQFTADGNLHYVLRPFFLPKGYFPTIGAGDMRVTVDVEQWLVRGQGAVLSWDVGPVELPR